jgi:phosphoserine phosphatase
MAVVDVDWKNAFPSIEWDSIRDAVEELLPEVSAWTRWCHAAPWRVVLPSGGVLRVDRGQSKATPG